MRDGWLHTGDIGELDGDGYIKITDRKKDLIVLSGGDNISPARVESFITLEPEIAQVMVYGDKKPHLVAAVVPDETFVKAWAKEQGKSGGSAELADDPGLREALSAVLDRVNQRLSNLEKVRRFKVLAEPFSVDNEMLTPTLKIRRHKIRAAYGTELEGLYGKK